MNIWMVNQYAVPPSQAGITRHYAFAKELQRRGYHVTVVASSFDHMTRGETRLKAGEMSRSEMVEGVPFLWIRSPPYSGNSSARVKNILSFAWSVGSRLPNKNFGRPDLVMGSSPTLFAALAAERLAAQWQIPFVLEIRDLWPESLISLGKVPRWHPLVKVLGWIESYLYRRAEKIISLLPNAKNYIAQKGGDAEKISWVPNGVDLDLFPPPIPPLHSGTFEILYAGSHGLANGLDAILDAALLLQEEGFGDRIKFKFVGDGPGKPHLERRARSEGISNVKFSPPVPKKEVFCTLSEADAFIVTLRKINLYRFGTSLNKVYDYLALARPVIFGADSINNPVSEANAGYVVAPEDSHAMADAVKKLAGLSQEERWQMGLRGRMFVEEHHDIAKLAAKLEKVFLETIEGCK